MSEAARALALAELHAAVQALDRGADDIALARIRLAFRHLYPVVHSLRAPAGDAERNRLAENL